MRKLYLLFILYLLSQNVFPQSYVSRNNYTGNWETPTSWTPTWNTPQTSIGSYDIIINGYITVNGSLSFTGVSHYLIVNDTLVILGNLSLSNNQNVTINGNGIIIVRGDLILNNSATLFTNGYLVVTGNVIKNGSAYQGFLISNNNPEKVFIGGAVSPASLTDNNFLYPALNCTAPATFRYPNSNCGYGNMTDFMNDPLYPFFLTTCPKTIPTITASGPTTFCAGGSVTLTSSTAASYLWSNGKITQSINVTLSGSYATQVTIVSGCQSEVSAAMIVTVNPLPMAAANSNSPICVGNAINLTSSGGAGYIWNGPEGFTSAEQNPSILDATATMSGMYMVTVTSLDGCTSLDTLSVLVNEYPLANAGPDQELDCINSTQMQAVLSGSETGEWSLISGSGNMLDLHSPTTSITGLSNGENIFSWKVQNGNCEASAEVRLIVKELFIPSVITPNGDGKNDYFKISKVIGQAELIIFNGWGNEEYTNKNYTNDWDGSNNQGRKLPSDTYFYILRFENGLIRKGSVLIIR